MVSNKQLLGLFVSLYSLLEVVNGKIYQRISLDSIRIGVNETYEVQLNEVFTGPNLSFEVTGFYNSTTDVGYNPYTTPQFQNIASVSKSNGLFNGYFGQPEWFNSTNNFWAVDNSNFIYWNATDLMNITQIATVNVGTGQGLSIFPQYHADTGRTYINSVSNNSYLTIYTVNVTDLANPLILRQLRVENQLLNQISWEDQPFLNQTWVAINNLGAGISAVYSIPYDTSQPITKAFQFDQTFVNSTEAIELVGAGLYNGELCVCVAGQGITKVDLATNSTVSISFPLDANDTLEDCTVQGHYLFATTKQGTFIFNAQTLQVVHTFFRNYNDESTVSRSYYNQIYNNGMFYSYQEKTTGSTSVKYFEVWNYYQEPNSALVASIAITNMFSSYDYADFPAFQIIPGVANQVIFYARYAVYVFEFFPEPTMTIDSGLNVPFDYAGTFRVSSLVDGDNDQLTLDINIQGVSVNSTEIYNYRGNVENRGYVQLENIKSYMKNPFNETTFWIPLENYLVGQNITYRVSGNDTIFDIQVPNKYSLQRSIQIEPNTYNSPELSVKTVEVVNNVTDYLAFIDGQNINVYLYNIQTQNNTIYTTTCNDGNMQPNIVVFGDLEVTTQTDVFVALECYQQSQDTGFDVTVQLYRIYNNQLYLIQKVQTPSIMYSTKIIYQSNVIYCLRGRQIDTYIFDEATNSLNPGSPISVKNLIPQFDINPVDFVIDSNQGLLYAYDFNLGLVAVELGSNTQTFYYSFMLGQLQELRSQDIKLYMNANSLYLINPYSQDNSHLVKLDPNTNFVRYENFNLTISETYPHIVNCRYQGIAFSQQFLAANCWETINNQVLIFAINSPSFYQLYTTIPLERDGFIGMSSYSVAPNLYVISDGNLNIYTVGQTFRNGEVPPVSNPLIPLENEEVTTWAAVSIETAQPSQDYYESITISGMIGNISQNVTITLDIINQGQTPQPSSDFNPNDSELTKGKSIKVKKSDIVYTIPSNIALGQAINYEFVNDQTKQRFVAQQICSSSNGPFCTETKSFRYTQLSEADDVEVVGSNIYISANNTITEYTLVNQNTTTIGRTYNLTKFGQDTTCNYVRSVEQTDRFVMSCSYNTNGTKQYFFAYIDFSNPNITAVFNNDFQSEILDVYQYNTTAENPSTIFVCAKNFYEGQILEITFDTIDKPVITWTYYIDGYELDIYDLSIGGLYHLSQNYLVMILSDGYTGLYQYQGDQLESKGVFQIGQEFYTGDSLNIITSVVSQNKTEIYNILTTGDIYRVDLVLNGDLSTFNETLHIPSFNENTSVTKTTAYLYQDTYLVFSLEEKLETQNNILIRLIDLSQSLFNVIYDDTVVSTASIPTFCDGAPGRVVYYANGANNYFITNLGYSDQIANIYQYRYSVDAYLYKPMKDLLQSTETYTVYLAACNADSCTQLGQTFDVEFEDSSSSDDEVYKQWWFWFIITLIGLAVVAGIIVLVLYCARRKKAEERKGKFTISDKDIEVSNPML